MRVKVHYDIVDAAEDIVSSNYHICSIKNKYFLDEEYDMISDRAEDLLRIKVIGNRVGLDVFITNIEEAAE
jgi:hypothetical protein